MARWMKAGAALCAAGMGWAAAAAETVAAQAEVPAPTGVAQELCDAQKQLGEITGQVTSDDLLGRIFGSFCIGK